MAKRTRRYSLYTKKLRRFGYWRAIAAALCVLAVALSIVFAFQHRARTDAVAKLPKPVPATPAAKLLAARAYGLAAGSSLTALSDQELNNRLQAMSDLGVQWVRYDFDWSLIQPDRSSTYNWATYDKLVTASNKHHLQVLGILDYTPAWARTAGCDSSQCAPAKTDEFAAFAGAVVHHYASQNIHAWEIWNEPNSKDFWKPTANPAAYTALLQRSYLAIKAEDAGAYVMTGGLSPQATNGSSYAPVDFLTALYQHGAQQYLDGVADHPYTFPISPTNTADHAWNQMAAESSSLRAVMKTNGDEQKRIWITEFGSPTGGPGAISTIAAPNLDQHPYKVDEALQAKILTDALALYKSYSWAGPFFVYSLQDAGTSQSTNENFFGLRRYDGTLKPAYGIYQQAAQSISSSL